LIVGSSNLARIILLNFVIYDHFNECAFQKFLVNLLTLLASKMMLSSLATIAFVVLSVTSWMSPSDAINVDATPCLQGNWFTCGTNLGRAVFRLHSWSDEVSYQVK